MTNRTSGLAYAQGLRPTMEDAHICVDSVKSTGVGLYAVMDGHGGIEVADFVAENLLNVLTNTESFIAEKYSEALVEAFIEVDKQLLSKHLKNKHGKSFIKCGCCTTAALVVGERLYIASAGDCRGILYDGTTMIPMSRDHKAGKSYEKERLAQTGGTLPPTCPSRAFGDFGLKPVTLPLPTHTKQYTADLVTCIPEVQEQTISTGFVIIACDGVFDKLSNQEAVDVVLKCKSNGQDAKQAAETLVNTALEKKTKDNVSVCIIYL